MSKDKNRRPLKAGIEALLGGGAILCARCAATLESYGDVCSAPLDERCPGFEAIENAIAAFRRETTAETRG